jgi:hypothetical protein
VDECEVDGPVGAGGPARSVQVVQVAAEHLGARGGEGGGGQRSARLTRSVPPPRAWLVSSALPVSWPALAER